MEQQLKVRGRPQKRRLEDWEIEDLKSSIKTAFSRNFTRAYKAVFSEVTNNENQHYRRYGPLPKTFKTVASSFKYSFSRKRAPSEMYLLALLAIGVSHKVQLEDIVNIGGSTPTKLPSELRVGCFDYPPFIKWSNVRKNGEKLVGCNGSHSFSGPWFYITQQICDFLKWPFKYELLQVPKLADGGAGKIDLVVGLFESDLRKQFFRFSNSIHQIGIKAVANKQLSKLTKADFYQGVKDNKYRVAVQIGEVGWEFVNEKFACCLDNGNFLKCPGMFTADLLIHLQKGRADIAIADEVSCKPFLEDERNKADFTGLFENRPFKFYQACVAIRKDLNVDMQAVNIKLTDIMNSNEYRELEREAMKGYEELDRGHD